MGVLAKATFNRDELLFHLQERYGEIETISQEINFTFSDYYDAEMGGSPVRFFVVFQDLIDPQELARVKLESNAIEDYFSLEGKRRVNLDPGILTAANLILATTKNRSHRIPLERGIYGEVTLLYSAKKYNSFPWTYPDYNSKEVKEFFLEVRQGYLKELKQN